MPALVDISGVRFGRAVAIKRIGTSHGEATWECACDCGKIFATTGRALRSKHTQSCGCLQSERTAQANRRHGHSPRNKRPTRTYQIWGGMINRCENARHISWKYYGALGVSICERWRKFDNFLEDMGEAPAGMSIDRIDPTGNYEPGNCRWATWSEQAANKRRSTKREMTDEQREAIRVRFQNARVANSDGYQNDEREEDE